MKMITKSALLLCMALLLCALMAACHSGTATPTTQSTAPTPQPTTGAHTHTFGQWELSFNATCTEDGLQERRCDCGEKEEQVLPATDHIPGEWVIYEDATATQAGSRHIYCLSCDALLQTEVIPATGTTGLSYQINEDGTTCTVTGIGTCTDSQLVIGAAIDGYTVTAIGPWAFELCSNLYSVTIPDSVTSIGDGAFSECSGLASITLSNSLTSISSGAFSRCTRLSTVVIPDSITVIDYSAFSGCTSLRSINIPDGVTYIGTAAFSGCTALDSISFPDSVTYVGENVLQNTAYYKNDANWENDLLYAGNHIVAAKQSISGARVIKAGTKTICHWAFRDCTGLTGITIPDGVITIGGNAFYGCTNLTSISIPDSVHYMGSSAFYLTGYSNNETNWENGVLYVGNHVVETKEDFSGACIIKPGTRTICDFAFSSRSGLTMLSIPNSVTYIGQWAFADCAGLTTLDIPDSVTYLGEGAFRRCTSLTSVTIGSGVTSIDYEVFFRCYSLSTITISANVTSIDMGAFNDCMKLADIHFGGTKAQWEAIIKNFKWANNIGNYIVHCTDGDITK